MTLAPESLEQRAVLAVDSFMDATSYVLVEDAECRMSGEIIAYSPCTTPTADTSDAITYVTPPDMSPETESAPPPAPPTQESSPAEPFADGSIPAIEAATTDDFLRSMALVAAQAEADAQRQAAEEARREAEMQAEMAAYFQRLMQADDGDLRGEPSCAVEPVCGSDDVDMPVWMPTFESEEEPGAESPAEIGEPEATHADPADEDCGKPTASIADPGGYATDPVTEEACGTESIASDTLGTGVVPAAAGVFAGESTPEEPAVCPDPSAEVEYVYDWDLEEQKRQADESRERLMHEVYEHATKLNIESEGRFAEGIVYTEDELVARLQAHIEAPQAIEGVEYVGSGDDLDFTREETVAGDPLAGIPATVVPPRGMPRGVISGMLANNAEYFQEMGGFVGAVGHMVNGTASGVVSLFDVVAPRCAVDLYSVVLFGRGLPGPRESMPVQTREAAEFADYIYDKRFDDDGAEAGGLLKDFKIPYAPVGGLQAALFRGKSGTFYLVARGTESREDWLTNAEQAVGGRTAAYEAFTTLARETQIALAKLGGRLIFAGHSKGGGLSIAAAHAAGLPAEAFNPAYVNDIYTRGQPAQIRINVVYGDPLDLYRRAAGLPPQGEMHYYHSLPARGINHNIGHLHER